MAKTDYHVPFRQLLSYPCRFLEIEGGDVDVRVDDGLSYVVDTDQRRLTFSAHEQIWALRYGNPESFRCAAWCNTPYLCRVRSSVCVCNNGILRPLWKADVELVPLLTFFQSCVLQPSK